LTFLRKLVSFVLSTSLCKPYSSAKFLAKKIPIEHILASTRSGAGRLGASTGRFNSGQEGAVNLNERAPSGADACNC
jgi:hypothetical protein